MSTNCAKYLKYLKSVHVENKYIQRKEKHKIHSTTQIPRHKYKYKHKIHQMSVHPALVHVMGCQKGERHNIQIVRHKYKYKDKNTNTQFTKTQL